MSIPLVQNNEKDSINTSIIAIKRNIERINMLLGLSNSEEIDTSEFVKKSDIVDVVEAGNMNPVTSNAVVPVDEVTLGNMHSVTSNAVAGAFSKCFPKYANKVLIFSGKTSYNVNYTVPDNGFLMCSGWGSGQSTSYIVFTINGIAIGNQGNSDERISVVFPVKKGNVVNISIYLSQNNNGCYFVPCN